MKVTWLAAPTLALALILPVSAERIWAASMPAQMQASAKLSEISSVRKKVRRKAYVVDSHSPYYLRPGVKPSFGFIGPPGYAGEYAWRKSIGQCVEDLGYGRWSACGYR
jgi:hypothetical protein